MLIESYVQVFEAKESKETSTIELACLKEALENNLIHCLIVYKCYFDDLSQCIYPERPREPVCQQILCMKRLKKLGKSLQPKLQSAKSTIIEPDVEADIVVYVPKEHVSRVRDKILPAAHAKAEMMKAVVKELGLSSKAEKVEKVQLSMTAFPKVWEIIDRFKSLCKSRGWRVCEYEDLVEAEGEYHSFVWAQKVYINTFRRVVANSQCSIREGISCRTVNVSYMAWVLQESPPESAIRMVAEEPRLSKRIATYDLSEAYAGRPLCLKQNETKSVVFQEFEKFLNMEYDIKIQPIYKLPPLPPEFIPSQPEELSLGR